MSDASVILLSLSWWSAVGLTAAVLFVAFCGFWVYVWYLYFPIVVRLLGQTPLLVPEPTQPIAGGEDCEFRTADGLTLRGTYLKQRGAEHRGVILFGHESKGDRWNATPYVADLLDAG